MCVVVVVARANVVRRQRTRRRRVDRLSRAADAELSKTQHSADIRQQV